MSDTGDRNTSGLRAGGGAVGKFTATQEATLRTMYRVPRAEDLGGGRWTYRALAEWANETWGTDASREAVRNAVRREGIRADALTVSVARDIAAPHLEPELERLHRIGEHLETVALASEDPGKVASAYKAQVAVVDQTARLAGVTVSKLDVTSGGKPLGQMTDDELAAELRLILGAPAGEAGAGAGDPPRTRTPN